MGSVTMELSTFPAQRILKQQKRSPMRQWFLHGSPKVIKEGQTRPKERLIRTREDYIRNGEELAAVTDCELL
jgi:hypothetical protein